MLGKIKSRFRPGPDILPLVIIAPVFLLFTLWRLGTYLTRFSSSEAASRRSSSDIHGLVRDAVNAPYKLLQHGLYSIHHNGFFLRLASVIIAGIIAFAFYRLLTSLFGRIIGLFGSLLFISIPFFALSSRIGTPGIMLFLPAILMYLAHHLNKDEKPAMAWLALMVVSGIAIYTPGLLWWLIGAAALSYRKISSSLSEISPLAKVTGAGIFCLLAVPLIVVCSLHPSSIRELLAVPASLPSPVSFLKHLAAMAGSIFVHNTNPTSLLLGGQPILNILLLALVIFGGYALLSAARAKALTLIGSLVLSIIIAALNNDVSFLAISVPALIVVAAAGLRYLYIEWRSIFPRNPVPKTFALVLIALVTLSQLYFAANYVLVAWPHSPQIHSQFVVK